MNKVLFMWCPNIFAHDCMRHEAARPSRSTDLTGRLAVWMRLYTQCYKCFLIICWKVRLFLFAGVFWACCQHCAIVICFKRRNLLELRRVPDNIINIISFSKPLVLFWDKKIVIDEGNAWKWMSVYLGKNNLSIYCFRYIECTDMFLPLCRTFGRIDIYSAIYR